MISYVHVDSAAKFEEACMLFREYAKEINIDLSFQKFEEELDSIELMYSPPAGGIILCKQDVRYIACVAIRKIDERVGELKRMYVQPIYRHLGVGKNLLELAMKLARDLNYTTLRLDTLNTMQAAISLYKSKGFVEIKAYYHNPNATAVYFEKLL